MEMTEDVIMTVDTEEEVITVVEEEVMIVTTTAIVITIDVAALQGVVGTTTDTMTDVEEAVLAARVTDIGVAVVLHLRGDIVMTLGDAAGTMIAILPVIVDAIVMSVVTGKTIFGKA